MWLQCDQLSPVPAAKDYPGKVDFAFELYCPVITIPGEQSTLFISFHCCDLRKAPYFRVHSEQEVFLHVLEKSLTHSRTTQCKAADDEVMYPLARC